ncbi:MAG: hypothetical protein WCZ90_08355 [Melioribacteraceae bacterium]
MNRKFLVAILFACVLLFFFIFGGSIFVSNNMNAFAQVQPTHNWIISRGTSGQISSIVVDYITGTSSGNETIQFDRGEDVSFTFTDVLSKKNKITKGDTIAVIQSSQLNERLISLEGELAVTKANLLSQTTGEKEELVKEAEANLELAKSRVAQKRIIFDRYQQLFNKNLVSQEEFETHKWEFRLLEIDVQIYKSKLDALRTGVKPQEAAIISLQMETIARQLQFIKERTSKLYITSPIDGVADQKFSSDTLLTVFKTDKVILDTPIRIVDMDKIEVGFLLNIELQKDDFTVSGKIISISKEVKILDGNQIVFARILIDNSTGKLLPGMVVECNLRLGKISLNNYLYDFIFN